MTAIPLSFLLLAASAIAAPDGSVLIFRHTEGNQSTDYQYTSNATTTRLDRLGAPTVPPSPWNLIDRATGNITILHPHNQSITTLASDAFTRKLAGPHTPMPPGIGPDPSRLPQGAQLPNIPPIPSNLPGMAPAMGELKTHPETRTLHGHTCTRHTLVLDASLELELWLAESPDLPPFYLLLREGPPQFGQNDLLLDWPHLIRNARKFPLLAILREIPTPDPFPEIENAEPAPPQPEPPELARWEVTSIAPANPEDSRFTHPANFFQSDRTSLR
jgi:hypothetical protein